MAALKSIYRLKKNYQYNYVYKHAESVADKNFVLLYCTANCSPTKVGFSVSKKYGKAVERNRIRRQMKAAVSEFIDKLAVGYNAVIIPRRHTEYFFADIRQSLNKLFTKAGLLQ